jgi:hypothetical protein
MHCLVASGGVAQFQCNLVLRNLKASGISLKDVDDFASQVIVPKTWQRLTKTFFADRYVDGEKDHIKAFASEMISVIAILGIFLDAVVRPLGILRDHVSCFDDLRSIVHCLRLGDDVVPLVPRVRQLLRRHHEAFAALYPECCKPKLHYLKHAVDCIERFKVNLSCFAPERKHKEAKGTGSFTYKNLPKAIMTRMVYELGEAFKDEGLFNPMGIGKPIRADLSTVLNLGRHAAAEASDTATTAKGTLRVGDLTWVGLDLFRIEAFVKVVQPGTTSCKAIVVPFQRVVGQGWTTRTGQHRALDLVELSAPFCYLISGDRLFV